MIVFVCCVSHLSSLLVLLLHTSLIFTIHIIAICYVTTTVMLQYADLWLCGITLVYGVAVVAWTVHVYREYR